MEAASVSSRAAPIPHGRSHALAAGGALAFIVGVAATLRLANFAAVPSNPFYDAAVRSMAQSWHNFLFGAFEPGGSVSVDKVPLDLWLQVLSVKLIGFNSVALRLPAALAGTVAVALLYDLVRRVGGRTTALASAAALAVLPVAVLTARSDTMDSVMMALVVLAGWLTVRAAQARRAGWLVGAGVVLGLAFNVKLFEALVAAPALVALFWLGSPTTRGARARALAVGAAAFLVTSLAWIVPASLAPADDRPFPIGSTNGGIWDVVLAFNGTARLNGHGPAHRHLDLVRLFENGRAAYGALVGSALAPALVIGVAALIAGSGALLRRARTGDVARLRQAGVVATATWLATGVALFTVMKRPAPRYFEAMSPAIAIALGAGVTALGALATRGRLRHVLLLAAASVASVLLALRIGAPSSYTAAGEGALGVAGCIALGLFAARRRGAAAALGTTLALIAVLAVPLGQSARLVRAGTSDAGKPGQMSPVSLGRVSRYLARHSRGTRYEAAVSSALSAGPLIVRDGRPVLVLTTLYARPLVSIHALRRAIATGQVRFALLRDHHCWRRRSPGCARVVRWARAHGTDVSRRAGLRAGGTLYRFRPA